ncbi:MAG: formylglycine-generating enzyme family protein [Xanthomonadaceae bacterium]|jgi:formylglycine-generating enzyme required for sulfatase activity|nr:formylglycine-generating enzyme family protein [Xanthomonadaceae bacterium]
MGKWISRTSIAALVLATAPAAAEYVGIPGGEFRSMIRYEDNDGDVVIQSFAMMRNAVTNAEFLAFVERHPQWQRGRVPRVFSDTAYLRDWQGPTELGDRASERQPVTYVSWYAADAYCKEQDARLPTWLEWEYVAAADETRRDARGDPAWRRRILTDGMLSPASATSSAANVYGIDGLHGAHWEWVEDYSSLLSVADSRSQDNGDVLQFCGGAALFFNDLDNYAMLKRVALLAALRPQNTMGNLGFRCMRSSP